MGLKNPSLNRLYSSVPLSYLFIISRGVDMGYFNQTGGCRFESCHHPLVGGVAQLARASVYKSLIACSRDFIYNEGWRR